MKNTSYLILAAALIACISVSTAKPDAAKIKRDKAESFLPAERLGDFVAKRLDLTTFRSSFGPRREPGQRHFKDFKMTPTKSTEKVVEFDTDDWFYSVEILRRGDENKDGNEDLVVRFVDDSVAGTYKTEKKLLLTCFAKDGDLIALAYEP